MAISEELTRILNAKADIKSALEDKGVVIGESSTLDEYPALISEMETGGGGGIDTSVLIDLIEGDISTLEIPYGTTKIGDYAFANCSTLLNVVIPNTITSVGGYAFMSSGVTYINFNSANVSIGDYGFLGANKLSKIDLGNATYFGDQAFRNCNNLTSIIIPSTVVGWKSNTFQNTNNLNEYIVLTNSVLTNPGGNSFGPIPGNNKHIYVKGNLLADWKTAYTGYSNYMYPIAGIEYNASTLTAQAIGRPNLAMSIDGSLLDTSVYTFTPGNADASHVITVTSTDPSLGLLDTSTLEVLVPADVTNIDYMCLTCVDENGGTIGGMIPYVETQDSSVSDIYYSSDKRNWTLWNKTYSNDSHSYTYDTINMNENDALYFKATGLGNSLDMYDHFRFTMSGEMEGSGNAMSLLYGDNFENQTVMPSMGLYLTFRSCTTLTTAPDLPATTLNDYCYQLLFDGCSNLSYINALFIDTYDTSVDVGGETVTYSATGRWVKNVSTNGTFVKNPDAVWDVSGVNGVPEGWTIEGWTPPAAAGQTFVKVTSADQLADGKKCIIVYDSVAMGETITSGKAEAISVTAGDEIDISNTNTCVFTLEESTGDYGYNYKLRYLDGDYLSGGNNTSLVKGSNSTVWQMDEQSTYFKIKNTSYSSRCIRYKSALNIFQHMSVSDTTSVDAMLYVEKTT